jgi:cell wall-associated NlpC family hydrolase
VPDGGVQVTAFDALDIGDLVFFDGSDDDGDALDHVGMYLGLDGQGAHRFISSRKTPDGPTLADQGVASVLNGTGHYAKAFRAVRRL